MSVIVVAVIVTVYVGGLHANFLPNACWSRAYLRAAFTSAGATESPVLLAQLLRV